MEMYAPVWMVIAALIAVTSAKQRFTTTDYTIRPASVITDPSRAVKTFLHIRTTLECGVKCSQLALVSFFFVKQSSMCHCNDYVDLNLIHVPRNEQGNINYGFIAGAAKSTPMFPMCSAFSSSWTTFQRRMDGGVDFNRNWDDYVNGFGSSDGELWLGLEEIHQNTAAGCDLCIYLDAGPNNVASLESGVAMYSHFSVGPAATNYRLFVGGFSGTLGIGDSLRYHNGSSFTTYDSDNDDLASSNCATEYAGGWWFDGCFTVHLNGLYKKGAHAEYEKSIKWSDPWGFMYGLKITEMSFSCP